MVKKIPFDLIKEGQYLKLDIGKMMTVEQMLKMPTLQVLQELHRRISYLLIKTSSTILN